MFAQIKAVPKPAAAPAVTNAASLQPAAPAQGYQANPGSAIPAAVPTKPLPRGSLLNILV